MRHRIASGTGLGNPDKVKLDNVWTENEEQNNIIKEMLEEGIELFFHDHDGVDFSISDDSHTVSFGIEPAYKLDKLKIVTVSNDLDKANIEDGISYGFYGSDIVSTIKPYRMYKRKSKFTKFAEKWSIVL